jgi:FkbH-like protein
MSPLCQDSSSAARPAPLVAISATFTAELIAASLEFWIEELGWDYQVKFAPYNQVFQQLLDPDSLLARNREGVNVVLVRFEDWSRFGEGGASTLEDNVRRLVLCLRSVAEKFRSPLVVAVCPASPGFLESPHRAALAKRMEARIESSLRGASTVHLIRAPELADLYPVPDYYDPHGDELGHIPYTPAFYAALGTVVARKIHALRRAPYKAIVLDCDGTLWDGVCGEDGPDGVSLDPERRFLQEFMLAQRDAGILLCLSSKNNEQDVLETFRANPRMPLQPGHFVARRIDWEPKSAHLVSLAGELNLGLDSFIFVDDNPTECAELAAHCPEVLTLQLPSDPERIPAFLRHVWAFDHPRVTPEDRERAALYAQEIERGRLEKKTTSLEEFLAALNLEIRIAPMTPEQLPRVSQLTQRTNQMNFTSIRRSESEIQTLVRDGQAECLTVDVRDRFGSYGLAGVMIFSAGAEAIALDTFLLSCRALGRGVEHRMLARLGEIARERGLARVDVRVTPCARNSPALNLLESIGEPAERGAVDLLYRFSSERLANLEYRPDGSQPAAPPRPAPVARVARKPADFQRIATELAGVDQILEQIAARKRPETAPTAPSAAPRTELERQLAAIWAELLGLPSVGIHDNFFDLGGHSLLAVQLLSRVRQTFNVDLSLEVVYGGPFTVAELARAIDVEEIERAGADYAAILEEIEGLSDEEVRALLAAEQGGAPPP